jgi:hypothetical protein
MSVQIRLISTLLPQAVAKAGGVCRAARSNATDFEAHVIRMKR